MKDADLQCLQWGRIILSDLKLSSWSIDWSAGSSEGIVIFKTKTIHIHWPAGKPYYALMIHEIAHVTRGNKGKDHHDSLFAHEYMKLVEKYMSPSSEHLRRIL